MSVKELAEKFIKAEDEAWQKGSFNALQELEDPKVVYHIMALGQEITGWEGHKQIILFWRQGVPGVRIEWKYLTGEGNLCALSFRTSGARFTGHVPGFPPPTGKEVTANLLFVVRLNKGKAAESWYNGTITGLT